MNSVLRRCLNVRCSSVLPYSLRRCVATWSPLASAFNGKPNIANSIFKTRKSDERTGLFGYEELCEANGFHLLKTNVQIATDQLVEEALSPSRNRKMVQVFDDLSDTLCKVADMAEFVRVGHPKKMFALAAEDACIAVNSLVETLNTNRELYEAMVAVRDRGDICPTDDIDDRVVRLFLFDFEQSGIHLDEKKREKVVRLNEYILHLGTHFTSGTLQSRTLSREAVPDHLRSSLSTIGNHIIIDGLRSDSDNSLVREASYRLFLSPDSHQEELLDRLLAARNELASLCGFPTYAHRAVNGSLMSDPRTVVRFLESLASKLANRADDDYSEMLRMKQSHQPSAEKLHPWDTPYYTAVAKQQKYQLRGADFCPYFSLGACMEGLDRLFRSLYGVGLSVEEVRNGEVWHPDVVKLAVSDSSGVLGYIYCDLYERPDKPSQDCHYTIRGGRTLPDGSYQLPVVTLLLNLPNPTWGAPSLLSPGMLDNLFHEIGHGMHSMLARTTYQHVTGTRCSTDLAEVPSILMEFFASDPRVVRSFARHYATGEPIPDRLLEKLWASKQLFAASEMQMQVFYSMLDQAYHGVHPLGASTTRVLRDIQDRYYGLPYVNDTAWQLRFGHLVGYGAKYYAYLVSRAVASWIWYGLFCDDPFSSTAGEMYRSKLLAHGGAKPPKSLVEDLLKTEVTPLSLADALVLDIDKSRPD